MRDMAALQDGLAARSFGTTSEVRYMSRCVVIRTRERTERSIPSSSRYGLDQAVLNRPLRNAPTRLMESFLSTFQSRLCGGIYSCRHSARIPPVTARHSARVTATAGHTLPAKPQTFLHRLFFSHQHQTISRTEHRHEQKRQWPLQLSPSLARTLHRSLRTRPTNWTSRRYLSRFFLLRFF